MINTRVMVYVGEMLHAMSPNLSHLGTSAVLVNYFHIYHRYQPHFLSPQSFPITLNCSSLTKYTFPNAGQK